MKKATVFMLAVLGSSQLFAATAVPMNADGQMIIKTTDTPLLTENVRINLSTAVMAGVSIDGDEIGLSTCHSSGRTSAREVAKVTCSGTPSVCTEDVPKVMETKSGAVMNTATTSAGTVSPVYPNQLCTSANAAASAATRLNADATP